MGLKKPCAVNDGTCVLLIAEPGLDAAPVPSPPASALLRKLPPLLAANAANPLRELGGAFGALGPPRCEGATLASRLVGREGGRPGSPTGPVADAILLCLSRADA